MRALRVAGSLFNTVFRGNVVITDKSMEDLPFPESFSPRHRGEATRLSVATKHIGVRMLML
jgi:hypothetical protein